MRPYTPGEPVGSRTMTSSMTRARTYASIALARQRSTESRRRDLRVHATTAATVQAIAATARMIHPHGVEDESGSGGAVVAAGATVASTTGVGVAAGAGGVAVTAGGPVGTRVGGAAAALVAVAEGALDGGGEGERDGVAEGVLVAVAEE